MPANIVSVDEESLRKDIKDLVRKTVEETLNALLDEEASELVAAERYERPTAAATTPESTSPGPVRSSSASLLNAEKRARTQRHPVLLAGPILG